MPLVKGGQNLPPMVGIGLTGLPNIGGASGPPGPPGSGTPEVDSQSLLTFNLPHVGVSRFFFPKNDVRN